MIKKILFILVVLCTTFSFAQNKPNIIISKRYDFQKSENSYNINNMFKGILMSNFNVYFDDEVLPVEIAQNRCETLSGVLIDNSNMFSTKLKFVIKDCRNTVLFESIEVKSKEKDIQKGYSETLKLLSPEVKRCAATMPIINKEEEVVVVETKPIENKTIEMKADTNTNLIGKHKLVEMTNGFAIMDSTQNIVLQIYKTSNPSVFIADKFGVKGVFTKVEHKGFFEYYLNDKLMIEEFAF